MKQNQTIVLLQDDGEVIKEFTSIIDAYKGLQEVKLFDKQNGINTKYYFELWTEDLTSIKTCEVKITKRKNKYYMK